MNDISLPTSLNSSLLADHQHCSVSRLPARQYSERLQLALESRLKARLPLSGPGLTIYSSVWKQHVTPAGRAIFRLRASGRRTSDSEPSLEQQGWPTPTLEAKEWSESAVAAWIAGERGTHGLDIGAAAVMAGWPTPMTRDWKGPQGRSYKGESLDLPALTQMAGWPTPTTRDHKDGSECPNVPVNALLGREVWKAGWPTPRSADGEKNVRSEEGSAREMERKGGPQDLMQGASLAGWPTPVTVPDSEASHGQLSGDYRRAIGRMFPTDQPMRLTARGELLTGSTAAMPSGGLLNPSHSRWLMGYPPEWDDCAATAMLSSRKPRQSSSARSQAPLKTSVRLSRWQILILSRTSKCVK